MQEISPFNFKNIIGFTHGVVSIVGAYCSYRLTLVHPGWNWLYLSYLVIIIDGILRFFRQETKICEDEARCLKRTNSAKKLTSKCSRRNCDKRKPRRTCVLLYNIVKVLHVVIFYLKTLYALPGLVSAYLLWHDICWTYAIIPIALTFFPLAVFMLIDCKDNSLVDTLIIGNVIFLSVFCTHFGTQFGVIAAIVYCVTHFILEVHHLDDYPAEMMYCIGISAYCILALLTMGGSLSCNFLTCPVMNCEYLGDDTYEVADCLDDYIN